jgi:hypothetical protein
MNQKSKYCASPKGSGWSSFPPCYLAALKLNKDEAGGAQGEIRKKSTNPL